MRPQNLKPEVFFRGKSEILLRRFDIPRLSPVLKIRLTVLDRLGPKEKRYVLEMAWGRAAIAVDGEPRSIPDYDAAASADLAYPPVRRCQGLDSGSPLRLTDNVNSGSIILRKEVKIR